MILLLLGKLAELFVQDSVLSCCYNCNEMEEVGA